MPASYTLADLGLIDAPAEAEFDNLTALAISLLNAPIALVSVIDEPGDRQFFKSHRGLPKSLRQARQTPLSHSICRQVVAIDAPLSIADAANDPRTCNHPAVTELEVGAYLGAPFRNTNGTPLGALCVLDPNAREWSDADVLNLHNLAACVSDTVRLKESLRTSEALRTEQRDFTYAISHDLMAPLGSIDALLGEVDAVLDKDPADGRELLALGRTTLARMRTLVEDVLDYTRTLGTPSTSTSVDLNALLAGVIGDLRQPIEDSGAELIIEPLPIIDGDAFQLRMLLQNLLSNAVKFRIRGKAPIVRVSTAHRKELLALSVSDNGIGIEPAFQQRVFQLFKRVHAHQEYAGSGIGLTLCQRIAVNHGGRLELVSEPGAGSTFTLLLPTTRR